MYYMIYDLWQISRGSTSTSTAKTLKHTTYIANIAEEKVCGFHHQLATARTSTSVYASRAVWAQLIFLQDYTYICV